MPPSPVPGDQAQCGAITEAAAGHKALQRLGLASLLGRRGKAQTPLPLRRQAQEGSLDLSPGQGFLVILARALPHIRGPATLCAFCPSQGQTQGRWLCRPARSFPLQVFQFTGQAAPGWISAEAGEPLGLALCPLSLGRASCQGDDRIEFRVEGTNLVCLILSSLSLPPAFPSSLSSCFPPLFKSHVAIKRKEVICEMVTKSLFY